MLFFLVNFVDCGWKFWYLLWYFLKDLVWFFSLSVSLSDFQTFKAMMLQHKADKKGGGIGGAKELYIMFDVLFELNWLFKKFWWLLFTILKLQSIPWCPSQSPCGESVDDPFVRIHLWQLYQEKFYYYPLYLEFDWVLIH